MRRLLMACVLLLAFCASALAGPPEMPGYEGQQVTDEDGVTWVWYNEAWRQHN